MKLRDYLVIGWDQVKRRKVVTAMCAIGIAIGSAAIIVALSLGQSAQKYAEDQMNSFFKMDEITIMNNQETSPDGKNSSDASDSNSDSDRGKITKQKLEIIRKLPHVKAVGTYKEMDTVSFSVDDEKIGRLELIATNLESLNYFDNKFRQGGISDQENSIVLSYGATMGLSDEKAMELRIKQLQANPYDEGLWNTYRELDKVPTPLYQKQIKLKFLISRDGENPKTIEIPVRVSGVLAKPKGVSDNSVSYMKQSYISHELAEQISEELKAARSGKENGQPESDSTYSRIVVKMDDVTNVQQVHDLIKKLRLSPQNNLSQQDRLKDQFAIVRTIALGVGLFILFIASISIVVAMTMSTYQRRKQIGIMKVLGANLAQIRNMFIVESALLGFMGGLIGILFSYWVVWGINGLVFAANSGESGIIFISPWILGIGIFFAVLTGVLSGLYPAISASRTDALTAIKRD